MAYEGILFLAGNGTGRIMLAAIQKELKTRLFYLFLLHPSL
jgi:hypothetical protein